jgi:hypothetical protein
MGLVKLGGGLLDGYLAVRATSTSDSVTTPSSSLSALGSTTIGLAYAGEVAHALHAGVLAEALIDGTSGPAGLDLGAASARLGGIFTADMLHGVRLGLNLTYTFDNTAQALAATETARGAPVTTIERFAFGVDRVDHVDARVGGEVALLDGRLRPFLEYGIKAPVNRQSSACTANNTNGDSCLALEHVVPSALDAGVRLAPFRQGPSFLLAAEIGVTGTQEFIEELAPVAPWMIYAGGAYVFEL